jgi:hypothetical protein
MMMIAILLAATLSNADVFLNAVADRDVDSVKAMLEKDPGLANARSEKGRSAVTIALFAIKKGEESFPDPGTNATLRAILDRKPQLDMFDIAAVGTVQQLEKVLRDDPGATKALPQNGWSLLHVAAYAGNVANTELLIRSGADVNLRAKTRFRNTPLQTALLSGQYATAKLLLDHGADALVRQSKGFTPMHEAALLGRADLVELLLLSGAEINSMADNGETPLASAIRGHHDAVAALMRSKGASITAVPIEEGK